VTAAERLLEIEATFKEKIDKIVPLELDGETLRKIFVISA